MAKTKIVSLLSFNELHQLYNGSESTIIQVQALKQISERFVRVRMMDAIYADAHICDTKEDIMDVQSGDVSWFSRATCITVPGWRKTVKLGKTELVAWLED